MFTPVMSPSSARPIPPEWTPLGETVNTRYYLIGKDVVVVYPHVGSRDDGASAWENVEFQMNFARDAGHRCAFLVMITSLTSQDADARRIYATHMDPKLAFGAALIAEKPLARAIASFFTGLSRPKIPTRVFEAPSSALAWFDTLRPPENR